MSQPNGKWTNYLEQATLSDVGMRRSINQDSKTVVLADDPASWQGRGHIFIVADGMGAHAAGELASKLAVDNIPHTYYKLRDVPPPQAIQQSIVEANLLIHRRGQADPEFRGMGTTCSVLLLLPQGAVCGHVGDSRIYRLRKNRLEQLSFDHSLVWEMGAAGQIAEKDLPSFIPKNVITRSLGPNPQVQVDVEGPFPVEPGDTFLLCSDGLTGPVKDEEIGVILANLPLNDAVQTLVDLANLRGGPDNITVVATRVKDPLFGVDLAAQPAQKVARRPLSPVVWALLGACLLVASIAAVLGGLLVAGACLVVAAVIGGLGHLARLEREVAPSGPMSIGGPFGKGPYRSYDCGATTAMLGQFEEMIERLRVAAEKEQWPIDSTRFLHLRDEGLGAKGRRDLTAALTSYCAAIRLLLAEMRKSGGKTTAN